MSVVLTIADSSSSTSASATFGSHSRVLFDDKWHTAMISISGSTATLYVDCGFDGVCADCLYRDDADIVENVSGFLMEWCVCVCVYVYV